MSSLTFMQSFQVWGHPTAVNSCRNSSHPKPVFFGFPEPWLVLTGLQSDSVDWMLLSHTLQICRPTSAYQVTSFHRGQHSKAKGKERNVTFRLGNQINIKHDEFTLTAACMRKVLKICAFHPRTPQQNTKRDTLQHTWPKYSSKLARSRKSKEIGEIVTISRATRTNGMCLGRKQKNTKRMKYVTQKCRIR